MPGPTTTRIFETTETMPSFEASVRKASSTQTTLRRHGEHCSLDPGRLAAIGLVVGSQLRVKRSPDQFALYTVSETRPESVDTTVRMAPPARERLGATDEFDAIVIAQGPHPTLSDEQAEACSELVERLDDDGQQRGLLALAPHGGLIERLTDRQAERVAALLGSTRASVWRCRGFKAGGGALERWHITATDIHESSFPLLRTISTRGFAQAVAFHGFDEPGVLIGGAAPCALKEEVAAALAAVLPARIPVRIAKPSDGFNGDNPKNIVNRLTVNSAHGVQIEQSIEAREEFWEAIADTVAAVSCGKLTLA